MERPCAKEHNLTSRFIVDYLSFYYEKVRFSTYPLRLFVGEEIFDYVSETEIQVGEGNEGQGKAGTSNN